MTVSSHGPVGDSSFIGRGFAWPMGVDHSGAVLLSRGAQDLDQSIQLVLMTAPGERLMRPQFGCRIWELLFEPYSSTLVGRIKDAVRQAIAQWEPRVAVEEVEVVQDDSHEGLLHVNIVYAVRATNDRRNLVYPFYVIPHDAE